MYVHGLGVEQKSNKKWILAALASIVAILAMTSATYAHEVQNIVNEGKPNCYGKVASLHAKEGGVSGNGIKVAYAEQKHVAVSNLENDATFQEEVKAIQAYCRGETE